MLLKWGIFFIFFTHTHQLEISRDESNRTYVLTPYSTANLYKTANYLLYTFDVFSLQYIVQWCENLTRICQNQSIITKALINEIETNMEWIEYRPFFLGKAHLNQINFTQFDNKLLEYNINSFNSEINDENACFNLVKLSHNFIRLNRNLNELFKLNASAVLQIVSTQHFSFDVEQTLKNSSSMGLTVPFDFLENFYENFFQFSRFSFYQDNFTISLLFEIPVYEPVFVNRFHVTPVVIDSTPYILNSDIKFVIANNGVHYFFTNETIDSHCFWSGKRRFCFKSVGNYDCERDLISDIFSKESCFRKLPRENMITQIMDETFFTIFTPLTLQLRCLNSEILMQIRSTTKFTHNVACSMNTSFFEYSPKNPSQGLFIQKTDNPNSWFILTKIESLEPYLSYAFVIIYIIIYIVSLIIVIYYSRKRIIRARQEERISVRLSDIFLPYMRPNTDANSNIYAQVGY